MESVAGLGQLEGALPRRLLPPAQGRASLKTLVGNDGEVRAGGAVFQDAVLALATVA